MEQQLAHDRSALREFANAYRAHKERSGELVIGIAHAHEQFTVAHVPEQYAIESMRLGMRPATAIRLWEAGASIQFIDAYLNGCSAKNKRTTADAAANEISAIAKVLHTRGVPDDYALPLLRLGSEPSRIIELWATGITTEYATQLDAVASRPM